MFFPLIFTKKNPSAASYRPSISPSKAVSCHYTSSDEFAQDVTQGRARNKKSVAMQEGMLSLIRCSWFFRVEEARKWRNIKREESQAIKRRLDRCPPRSRSIGSMVYGRRRMALATGDITLTRHKISKKMFFTWIFFEKKLTERF